jgi:hypothetical protein
MKPENTPIESTDLSHVRLPKVICPVDSEDHFELADEADEFGVHAADHSANG